MTTKYRKKITQAAAESDSLTPPMTCSGDGTAIEYRIETRRGLDSQIWWCVFRKDKIARNPRAIFCGKHRNQRDAYLSASRMACAENDAV